MFSTDSLPYTKDGANVIHTMEKVKERIGFHYLLIDILVFDYFWIRYIIQKVKSTINMSLTIYLEYKMMILLHIDFIVLLS